MSRNYLALLVVAAILVALPLSPVAGAKTMGGAVRPAGSAGFKGEITDPPPGIVDEDVAQRAPGQEHKTGGAGGTPVGAGLSKLQIATDAAYPPFESVDPAASRIVGFDIDLMEEIAKAGGFEVEFINTPWDGIFVGLDNRNYDAIISAVSITADREHAFDFSNPYYAVYQALVVRKGDAGKYKSLSDLKGKRVGAQIGTTGGILVGKDPNVELVNYDDNGLAVEALLIGDVDAVVCDHPVAFDYARVNPGYLGKLAVTNPKVGSDSEPYGILVKKGNKKALDLINRGLLGLDPGVIPRLEEKWNMK